MAECYGGRRRIQWANVLLDYRTPKGFLSKLIAAITLTTIVGGVYKIAGGPSMKALLIIAGGSFASIFFMSFGAWCLKWPLLFSEVKAYVRDCLMPKNVIGPSTILVACGGGGAICAGMVSKAYKILSGLEPRIIVLDLEYSDTKATVASLLPLDFTLAAQREKVLIVLTNINYSFALDALKERLGLLNSPVFTMVLSRSELRPGTGIHFLVVGSRAIIPWPRTERPK